jgi:hypothetical protein
MDRERRYGFCKMENKWVPRDLMYGATIKFYERDGTEQRIPLRFSQSGMKAFMEKMRVFEWANELYSAQELRDLGHLVGEEVAVDKCPD